jgi:hypothetical protein
MRSTIWIALAVVVASIFVGIAAYDAGLAQGAAQGAAQAAAASGAAVVPPYAYYYGWGWHRPWGIGFAFPWLFLIFAFLFLRGCFWGGPWRRRWYYYEHDVPPSFEEWHRRAHERSKGAEKTEGTV